MKPFVPKGKKRAPAQPELKPPIGSFFSLLKPMEPQAAPEPFDSDEHFFQVKWDGVRMLAFIEREQVALQNRRGRCRTAQYPELQQLRELVRAGDALLDGEVVAMEEGKPSFARVIQRDFATRERSIRTMMKTIPCIYCLFDILYLDGEDLTSRPLCERLEILAGIVQNGPLLYLNENFDDGVALYRKAEEFSLEGIVAKEKTSPYMFGRKSVSWLKIKPRRRLLCVVGGLTVKGGSIAALLLGGYRDGELLYIGRAGSGLSRRDLLQLRDYAGDHAAPASPFVNPPRGAGMKWLQPRLTVMIEFAEWTAGLSLRAPVVVGFSRRPPEEARL